MKLNSCHLLSHQQLVTPCASPGPGQPLGLAILSWSESLQGLGPPWNDQSNLPFLSTSFMATAAEEPRAGPHRWAAEPGTFHLADPWWPRPKQSDSGWHLRGDTLERAPPAACCLPRSTAPPLTTPNTLAIRLQHSGSHSRWGGDEVAFPWPWAWCSGP